MVGGRMYWSPQQMAGLMVGLLLFVWGMVWVLHVMNYGMCKQEVTNAQMTLAQRERALAKGALVRDQELYELAALVQDFDEAAVRYKDAFQEHRLPVVVLCSAAARLLREIPPLEFAVHVATTEGEYDACAAKVEAAPSVHRVEVVEAGTAKAMLSAAVRAVIRSSVYPLNHMVVVESDVARIDRDGMNLLHALAAQKVLLDPAGATAATLGWGAEPAAAEGAASFVVRTAAPPAHVVLFPISGASKALQAWVDGGEVPVVAPLRPRARSAEDPAPAGDAVPVLFSAVDLSHLTSPEAYNTWKAKQKGKFPSVSLP